MPWGGPWSCWCIMPCMPWGPPMPIMPCGIMPGPIMPPWAIID